MSPDLFIKKKKQKTTPQKTPLKERRMQLSSGWDVPSEQ